MDELYILCEKIDRVTFDYNNALQQDWQLIKDIIDRVYYKYSNEIAIAYTWYNMLLEAQILLQRIGYTYTYSLDGRTLKVIIEGIVLK